MCEKTCPNSLKSCDLCGECTLYCPNNAREICGKDYEASELFDEIIKDKHYYDSSKGGVTFSGGECMLQVDFLVEILKMCKEAGIHTAIDTAGNVPYECFERVIPYTDTFLYDVKCITEDLHKQFTGVSNQQILSNLKKLSSNFNGDIVIRIPIICGFNDTDSELLKISDLLNPLNIKKTELLPYHKMGTHKYDALNMSFTEFKSPSQEQINHYKSILNKKI